MDPSTFLFIFIGTINSILTVGFFYYAFRNAFRLKGAVPQYLMTMGSLFFVITGITSAIGFLIFDTIFIISHILFIVGFILISISKIYSGMVIRKVIGKKSWLTIACTFSHYSYCSGGILVILLFSIPLWILGIISGPASIYDTTATLFTMVGIVLLVVGEKKLYGMTNGFSNVGIIVDRREINLIRGDIGFVAIYIDTINTFLYLCKPSKGAMISNDILDKWFEEHPTLFEDSLIRGNGKIDGRVVIQNLDRIYEKRKSSIVLREFSALTTHLVKVYGNLSSSEYAKERLEESYRTIKKKYDDIPTIFEILRTMPEGILKEEKLASLSRDELEEKVKERTVKIEDAKEKLQIEVDERKKAEVKLKKAHDKLRELNKNLEQKVQKRTIEITKLLEQKDEFINQLSHDLKTPLTPLVTLLPILEDMETDPKSEELFEILHRSVDRMKDLIVKTLELARINATITVFDKTDLNLWEVAESSIKDQQVLWNGKNIRIENMIDKNIFVIADKQRLYEVFVNLITNAIKYNVSIDETIAIDAHHKEDLVTVSVKDNGVGMTADQIDHIFNEFYKADGSRHDFNSSGLGLSICKRIIEKHDGSIWAESLGPNKGSTFYFTIPIGSKISKDDVSEQLMLIKNVKKG